MILSRTEQQIADYLRDNMGLEDEDIRELLDMLQDSTVTHLDRAEQQLAQKDWEGLTRTGHSIKGSAANLGAVALSEAGKSLEFAAKEQNCSACDVAIKAVKTALNKLTGS